MSVLAAPLFVLIWSSGFVVARLVHPHADPQLFLLVRMALVVLAMAGLAAASRDRWPGAGRAAQHVALGALMPGFYLCGGWWAVGAGMPAGIMSLLGSLQPLMIAGLSGLVLGERLTRMAWAGLGIGTAGVAMVLAPAVGAHAGAIGPAALAVGIAAVVAMAGATMIQRARLAHDALAPAVALQNIGGAGVATIVWALTGAARWQGGAMLWGLMAWSVIGLSAVALTLLAWMLRRQGAARVSALLLLVPPLAAIEAWALFEERLGAVQVAGFAVALAGVALARRRAVPAETAARQTGSHSSLPKV